MMARAGRDARTVQQTEKEFQAAVVQLARLQGWLCYHTYDSRRSEPGFPDLVLVRDRVLFWELKGTNGKLSPAQVIWLDKLEAAGAEVDVWWPKDWKRIERVLSRRTPKKPPTVDEFVGHDPDFTGEMTTAEYMEHLRDG